VDLALAAYFIANAIWNELDLQWKLIVIAGSAAVACLPYYAIWLAAGANFGSVAEHGMTLTFANADYQSAFDRLNQPVRRMQNHILHFGAKILGPPPPEIEGRIRGIHDFDSLQRIYWTALNPINPTPRDKLLRK